MTFGPLVVPLLIAVPFGPLMAWKRGDFYAVSQRLAFAAGAAFLIAVVTLLFIDKASALAAAGVALASWLMVGALTDLALKAGIGSVGPAVALARLRGLPRSVFGTFLAHSGLGLTVLGVVAVTSFQSENDRHDEARRNRACRRLRRDPRPHRAVPGTELHRGSRAFPLRGREAGEIGEVVGAKRLYTARQMPTTEAGIATRGFSQLYVSPGDPTAMAAWWCACGGSRS